MFSECNGYLFLPNLTVFVSPITHVPFRPILWYWLQLRLNKIIFRTHETEIVDELDNLQEALTNFRSEQEDGEEVQLHPFEVTALMNLVIADTSTLLFSVLTVAVTMSRQTVPVFPRSDR